MSIECDMEDNKENININKNKDIDEEILFNQSLNSIFFNSNHLSLLLRSIYSIFLA